LKVGLEHDLKKPYPSNPCRATYQGNTIKCLAGPGKHIIFAWRNNTRSLLTQDFGIVDIYMIFNCKFGWMYGIIALFPNLS
jgi:hypothetical protein